MTGLSSAGEAAVLAPLTAIAYVSLHTADPGSAGASEVSGGAYARQGPVAFSQRRLGADGGVEQRHSDLSAGDGAVGRGQLFRSLDCSERRDVSGLGSIDHAVFSQQWRFGEVPHWLADDYGAMTWRRPTARDRMETGSTA